MRLGRKKKRREKKIDHVVQRLGADKVLRPQVLDFTWFFLLPHPTSPSPPCYDHARMFQVTTMFRSGKVEKERARGLASITT